MVLRVKDLRFVADSDVILSSELWRLDAIAAALKALPDRSFLVAGHSAAVGKAEGELELSIRARQARGRRAGRARHRGLAPALSRFRLLAPPRPQRQRRGEGEEPPRGDHDIGLIVGNRSALDSKLVLRGSLQGQTIRRGSRFQDLASVASGLFVVIYGSFFKMPPHFKEPYLTYLIILLGKRWLPPLSVSSTRRGTYGKSGSNRSNL